MSLRGTHSHATATGPLPARVAAAVELARSRDFPLSCRVEQGRLVNALAHGARVRIGETGTGLGVGLAWLLEARHPGVPIVSVDREAQRVDAVRDMFADEPDLTLLHDDWRAIEQHGPFDLLILDGGGNGKQEPPVDPTRVLTPGGAVVIDDFTPADTWPPLHEGKPDDVRMWWLEHPALRATEVRLADDLSTIIATRRR
jgi:predicted O-methyltransferase YrrM